MDAALHRRRIPQIPEKFEQKVKQAVDNSERETVHPAIQKNRIGVASQHSTFLIEYFYREDFS
jgi:hypothetical protein